MKKNQKFYLIIKRIIDIFGSLIGILFCLTLIWWWVFIINLFVTKGHPVFARHRIGKNGKPFRCLKFRSMRLDANPHMTSRDENAQEYLTSFGKFLRETSIDETLQLFNIFVGQMSFIGPRPLIDVNEDVITINLRKENGSIVLRPGLSGYAQIFKRGSLDPVKKAELDYEYFKNISFWFDFKIFFYTILKIFGAVKGK